MNYLNRPVFQFPINWSDAVNKSFTYDLKEISLGFGAEYFTSLQNNVVQGWSFSLDLFTDSDIKSLDAFTAALYGRLVGFWLPTPMEAMQIVEFEDRHDFVIVAQGFANTWNDHPDVHLYFVKGTTAVATKVIGVIDNGDGTELVSVDASLAGVWPSVQGLAIYRLHYVRLADDVEQGTFIADGHQQRTIKVVELPEEYTNLETGLQSIFLYHFWFDSPASGDWYYTSFAADVFSNALTYQKFPIEHGTLATNSKGDAESVDISAQYDPSHPFSLFLPLAPARPLNVEIFEVQYGALNTQTRRFTGQIRTVEDQGEKLVAHCDSFLEILSRKAPRHLIGPTCPYALFDLATCKLQRYLYEVQAQIVSVTPFTGRGIQTVVLSAPTVTGAMMDPGWFAQGFIQSGFGSSFEQRVILSSTFDDTDSQLTITIAAPLLHAQVNGFVQLIPGCDGTKFTCMNKFNNYLNFGGFPYVPTDNPTIASVQQNVAAGGKK